MYSSGEMPSRSSIWGLTYVVLIVSSTTSV